MKEIGGYIELDSYSLPMLHENAIALNCGRNALWYLIRAKKIKKILLPKFLCDSVRKVCEKEGVEIKHYSITMNFIPKDIVLSEDEWLYVVNYYGQLDNEKIKVFAKKYKRVIVDNAQAYFQMPVEGIDTLYTCRKFWGVADGAFLYTDIRLDEDLSQDESYDRMRFLLGRFERTASEFYSDYTANNQRFAQEAIKIMSKLTNNLLHGIDYDGAKQRRTENFNILQEALGAKNHLKIIVPEGAFMYPFYVKNGAQVRKKLQEKNIYIPILWPDVFECCDESEIEYDMARNILPLPVDQRYNAEDMLIIIKNIEEAIMYDLET